MKRTLFILLLVIGTYPRIQADNVSGNTAVDSSRMRIFEGRFYNQENDITIALNLYDTVLVVRNYEFLGKMNGYMHGSIHETWFVASYTISKNSAVLHFSNEMGSEDQSVKVTMNDSVNMLYEILGSNAIRKAVSGRWVKLPSKMIFRRQKSTSSRDIIPSEEHHAFKKY